MLREATLHNMVVPVLCGSALDGIGVQPVLDAVADYLPSPADVPPVEGVDPKKQDVKLVRKPDRRRAVLRPGLQDPGRPPRRPALRPRLFRRAEGQQPRATTRARTRRRTCPQLWRIQADRRKQVDAVEAGDIIGVIGLHHSVTGDTLCDPQEPILLESITFPETVISMAIEPETPTERKKLADVLEMMKRQDPTFRARENEETGQTLISGMGELHLEVIKHRLLRDYRLNVRVHKPRVSYRETIAAGGRGRPASATATWAGRCSRPRCASAWSRIRTAAKPVRSSLAPGENPARRVPGGGDGSARRAGRRGRQRWASR